jgi:DNA (cytosine-5)-methyltransferase 1
VYAVLRRDGGFLTMDQILRRLPVPLEIPAFERHLAHLRRDFYIEVQTRRSGDAYKLGPFKAFTGQDDTSATRLSCAPPRSADPSHLRTSIVDCI